MGVNQLNEKLSKIQNSSMKSSQVLGQMGVEGSKKLSQVHTSLANHVAKNMQLAAANVMTAKSPAEVWNAVKGDGGAPFIEGWKDYQKSFKAAVDEYMGEFMAANEELHNNFKDGVNELFRVTFQNAPDGMEAFIKPYQSAFNIAIQGADQAHELAKNYIEHLEVNLSGSDILKRSTGGDSSKSHSKTSNSK